MFEGPGREDELCSVPNTFPKESKQKEPKPNYSIKEKDALLFSPEVSNAPLGYPLSYRKYVSDIPFNQKAMALTLLLLVSGCESEFV